MTAYHPAVKKFFLLLTLLLSLPLFNACDKDNEYEPNKQDDFILWDFYPLNIPISIRDANGTNLLAPDAPGSLYGTDISIEWEEKTYPAQWEWTYGYPAPAHEAETRVYMPMFHGLRFEEWYTTTENGTVVNSDKCYLSFGEFESDANYDMSFTLRIEDCPETYLLEVSQRSNGKTQTP